MSIAIDIQGLTDKHYNFIPKEVAVASIDSSWHDHWIVAPPHAYRQLPPDVKRANERVTREHHGIKWFEGHTPLRCIERILRAIATDSTRIFVRGAAKSSYLAQLTGYYIINLEEDEDNISFQHLPGAGTHCSYHAAIRKNQSYKCALDNVMRIKTLLCQSERRESLWEYRTTTALSVGLPCDVSCYEQPSNPRLST